MPSKKSQTLRSCDEIQIETRGQSIVITTDSEEEFELQVTISINGTCRSMVGCVWDGQRWVC